MTDEERESAIERMADNALDHEDAHPDNRRYVEGIAGRMLDALLEEFVVIAKGDVIWVCKHHGADVDHLMLHDGRACAHITEDGSYCRTRLARTHWEPTTTPEAFA